MNIKPVILVIMDGWGIAPPGPGNAIKLAKTPNYNKFITKYPHAKLVASGESVGLPRGEVGNTETGHLNIGAGKIVYQDLPRINMSIADGSFFQSPALIEAIKHTNRYQSQLHIMGLIGPGGVHSKIEHLLALIKFCNENNITNLAIHAFTDGRDSPPTSSQIYLDQIASELQKTQVGYIASVMGRYYAMDRDMRWDRTEKAYLALTQGIGNKGSDHATIVNQAYKNGQTDEFIEPTLVVNNHNQPKALIKKNDAVIFFNFRIDRPRQLTKAFVLEKFNSDTVTRGYDPYEVKYYGKHQHKNTPPTNPFDRDEKIPNLYFATMTEYEKRLPVDGIILPPNQVKMPLGRIIEQRGWKQLHASESEKERFVTYYINGQKEIPFQNENRIIVPSPKIPTYDQQPEMSAYELTDKVIERLTQDDIPLTILNYANADMVGHTGNLQATIKAVEAVDQCIGRLTNFILSQNGAVIITADHGNAESMINLRTGNPETEHSGNLVPFIIISKQITNRLNLGQGILADISPTILKILGIPKPSNMTGDSLIK